MGMGKLTVVRGTIVWDDSAVASDKTLCTSSPSVTKPSSIGRGQKRPKVGEDVLDGCLPSITAARAESRRIRAGSDDAPRYLKRRSISKATLARYQAAVGTFKAWAKQLGLPLQSASCLDAAFEKYGDKL